MYYYIYMYQTDTSQKNIDLAKWFLRAGLAFVYLYAAIEIQLNPQNFLKYVPPTVQTILPTNLFLLLFGIFEVALAACLLSGKFGKYMGLISFILMTGIIFPNLVYFSVLFRNVAIALASLALVALETKHK